jgi:hypothetical protein
LAGLAGQQLTQLASELPQYQYTIAQKIQNIRNAVTLQRISEFLTQVNQENLAPTVPSNLAARRRAAEADSGSDHRASCSPFIQRIIEPLLDPLTTLGVILLFVIFFSWSGKPCAIG